MVSSEDDFKTRSKKISNDSLENQEKLFFDTQISRYQLKGPSLDSSKRAILSFQGERCPRYEHRKKTMSNHAYKWNFPFFHKNNFFKKIGTFSWICLKKCYYRWKFCWIISRGCPETATFRSKKGYFLIFIWLRSY